MPTPPLSAVVKLFDDKSERRVRILAHAELVIADSFVVKGVRVLARSEGSPEERRPFVAFPAQRRVGSCQDRWYDIAHPTNQEAREAAVAVVLAEYARALGGEGTKR